MEHGWGACLCLHNTVCPLALHEVSAMHQSESVIFFAEVEDVTTHPIYDKDRPQVFALAPLQCADASYPRVAFVALETFPT